MQIVLNIIIFIIILFFYIHINYQLTTSNDLEVYDITDEDLTRERMDELCSLKQPIVFKYNIDRYTTELNIEELLINYGEFDIYINSVPIKLSDADELFKKDVSGKYITEGNRDFLEETTKKKTIQMEDLILRPALVSNSDYDIIMGSKTSILECRYEINERTFFIVNEGSVEVKLATPESKKYKEERENQRLKDKEEGKIKYMKVELKKGEGISIPNRWIYEITLKEKDTIIIKKEYTTIMNSISNLPIRIKEWLQEKNSKLDYNKKIKR